MTDGMLHAIALAYGGDEEPTPDPVEEAPATALERVQRMAADLWRAQELREAVARQLQAEMARTREAVAALQAPRAAGARQPFDLFSQGLDEHQAALEALAAMERSFSLTQSQLQRDCLDRLSNADQLLSRAEDLIANLQETPEAA